MKIFRQLMETDGLGFFVVDAIHEDGVIQDMKVFSVKDRIVGKRYPCMMEDLTELIEKVQVLVTASLEG
jgi:hypothetical protein